jgi:uncharacterized protein YcgI (DUF1989 family)
MTKAPKPGKRRLELTLEPVSGKAVPVYKGEILRITQIEGGQCVDFNCFNLNDYKEYMSVGHMRREAFHPTAGQFIWSNPPRYRPMMKIVSMPKTCVADSLAARCSAVVFESHFGIDDHPNCQDTLAEAIGEYGLTPDDVHDSLNLWMNTETDHIGYYTVWNSGKAGDAVDLMAVMDVLAVPATCGSGDLWVTSNFFYKPVRIEIFEATAQTKAMAEKDWKAHASLKSQRTPKDFINPDIRTEPELKADPNYKPQYINYPIEWKDIDVIFSNEEFMKIWTYRGLFGDTDEEVVRTLFFHWYLDNRKKHGVRLYAPKQSHA